jgi:hypothetical protein
VDELTEEADRGLSGEVAEIWRLAMGKERLRLCSASRTR